MDRYIAEITCNKGNICRELLSGLPEWFGIPEAIEMYAELAETYPTYGYTCKNEVIAFACVRPTSPKAIELATMAVRRSFHRKGIGRELLSYLHRVFSKEYLYLTVKTLAPEHKSQAYVGTRRFYESVGFVPIETFKELWGPENPCLLMVKALEPT